MKRRWVCGLIFASVVGDGVACGTPGSLFVTTPLARSMADTRIDIRTPARRDHDVLVQQVVGKPGGFSGWHSHPGHGIVVVYQGRVAIYDGDDPTCTPKYYSAGEVFTEEPGHVHFVRSDGAAAYKAFATFVMPVGVASRTDVPSPGNCPF
jgi:quercetin dioxygenase-like cupin family protein